MLDVLGLYIHIPFCIQRCSYCDFATYAKDQIQANDEYVDNLCREISLRKNLYKQRELQTIYFGGGTPSLLNVEQIRKILSHTKNEGFRWSPDIEVTMEVNPATLTNEKCEGYKASGVNRMSIGCQSFNDNFLKACDREHNADDTRRTIELVKKHFSNFSLDFLFSLPKQGLKQVSEDIKEFLSFEPPHVSAYCLTLPERHPMNRNRANDLEQTKMFSEIRQSFAKSGLQRYEISNFAKPSFESQHNNMYWTDKDYWGVGLSAHSFKKEPEWGYRFWNPSTYDAYMKLVDNLDSANSIEESFAANNFERLGLHESLTDFCHTRMRLALGLPRLQLERKFGKKLIPLVEERMTELLNQGLVTSDGEAWSLTEQGVLLSNRVFEKLLFSRSDIDKAQSSHLFLGN